MIFGAQLASFEEQVQENRTHNLQLIEEQVGRGFQTMLVALAGEIKCFFSPSEMSNLCRGARDDKGYRRSEFHNYRARSIERALDLPRGSLDLPPWHFKRHLPVLWEYPSKAGANREWFDSLLAVLLDVPPSPPANPAPARSDAMAAVLARLKARAAAST